jgi:hypothetical protein
MEGSITKSSNFVIQTSPSDKESQNPEIDLSKN